MKIVLDDGAFKPYKAHPEDAGFDLMARERQIVPAQGSAIFDTGVHIEIPQGFVGFLKSKSGLNVIHDEPKELSEFCFPPERYCEEGLCGGCPYDQVPNVYGEYEFDCEWKRPIIRPPQSFCYVEEVR